MPLSMAFTYTPELVPLLHPCPTQCQQSRGSGAHETTQGYDQIREGQSVYRQNKGSSFDVGSWHHCPCRTRHPLDRREEMRQDYLFDSFPDSKCVHMHMKSMNKPKLPECDVCRRKAFPFVKFAITPGCSWYHLIR